MFSRGRLLFSFMKKLVILLWLPLLVRAQAVPETYRSITTITATDLSRHVAVLAHDSLGGRRAGSPQDAAVQRYLTGIFMQTGLMPAGPDSSFRQPFYFTVTPSPVHPQYDRGTLIDKPGEKRLEKGRAFATANVVGRVAGSDLQGEVLVVGAHYDHLGTHQGTIFNGADDNASGVAGLLELAQAFAEARRAGHGPRRTLLFVAFSGEELGLLGSNFFVEHPAVPLHSIRAMFNLDMIGRPTYTTDNLERPLLEPISINASDAINNVVQGLNLRFTKLNLVISSDAQPQFRAMSDHVPFARARIPAYLLTNDLHPDYHQPSDDAERLDLAALRGRVCLLFLTLCELANRNIAP